ncbi:hypothetical protein QJS66_02025 [Kocuria rhizophila]|nr:hypothetical protein QJS66_02025 [Kocuria rhizophila]
MDSARGGTLTDQVSDRRTAGTVLDRLASSRRSPSPCWGGLGLYRSLSVERPARRPKLTWPARTPDHAATACRGGGAPRPAASPRSPGVDGVRRPARQDRTRGAGAQARHYPWSRRDPDRRLRLDRVLRGELTRAAGGGNKPWWPDGCGQEGHGTGGVE